VHVCSLRLSHFRNYPSMEVEFHPQLNLFLGSNAQGKTNVLEAIYCLSTTRSFRAAVDDEMIQFEQEAAAIESVLQREEGQEQIRLEMRKSKPKTLLVNGKKQKKLSSLLGRLPAVVFSPDDLFLVKGGPSLRRRYLDTMMFQMDAGYLAHLQQYERTLKQRNSLLRQRVDQLESQLAIWDLPLAEHGAAIMQRRFEISAKLSQSAGDALRDLTGGAEKFEVRYEPSLQVTASEGSLKEKMLEALLNARREEMARGVSVVGPHRDDLGLWVNGQMLRKFGSQGQQRTGALALKLAQLSILAEGCHTAPLVLFDDVMAELDEKRQAFFLNRLQQGGQAFLTGTAAADFAAASSKARIFKVEAGQLRMTQEGPARLSAAV
jgi:DNA replication and repair protein RecF